MRTPRHSTLAAACLVTLGAASAGSAAGWKTEVVAQKSFEAAPGGLLLIDVGDANLELAPGSSSRVEVEVRLSAGDLERARERYEKMEVEITKSERGVEIRAHERRLQLGFSLRDRFELTFVVKHPETYDLDVHTGDGDVEVERLVGRARIGTGDGDVQLGDIEGDELEVTTGDGDVRIASAHADRVRLRTGDGDITAASLASDEAELRTGDGDIELSAVSGGLEASTGDGSVRVAIVQAGPTRIRSGDGDIHVTVPAGAGLDLDVEGEEVVLRASDGKPFEGERSSDHALGTLNGGGPRLQAHTGDGTVVIATGD